MENLGKEFYDYATKHQNISGLAMHRFESSLTPMIVEERQMNVAVMSVFDRLLVDRLLFLGTNITSYSMNIMIAQLLFLESVDKKKPIRMYVASNGGEVYSGLALLDTMNIVSPEIIVTCTGLVASMASVIVSNGAKGKRSALKHSRIMIHQPMGGIGPGSQASDIEITHREIQKIKKELYTILSENTGQDYDTIWKDSERDFWMTAQEAKDYGIIDIVLDKKNK